MAAAIERVSPARGTRRSFPVPGPDLLERGAALLGRGEGRVARRGLLARREPLECADAHGGRGVLEEVRVLGDEERLERLERRGLGGEGEERLGAGARGATTARDDRGHVRRGAVLAR